MKSQCLVDTDFCSIIWDSAVAKSNTLHSEIIALERENSDKNTKENDSNNVAIHGGYNGR